MPNFYKIRYNQKLWSFDNNSRTDKILTIVMYNHQGLIECLIEFFQWLQYNFSYNYRTESEVDSLHIESLAACSRWYPMTIGFQ